VAKAKRTKPLAAALARHPELLTTIPPNATAPGITLNPGAAASLVRSLSKETSS
jgi:hypothetical protein